MCISLSVFQCTFLGLKYRSSNFPVPKFLIFFYFYKLLISFQPSFLYPTYYSLYSSTKLLLVLSPDLFWFHVLFMFFPLPKIPSLPPTTTGPNSTQFSKSSWISLPPEAFLDLASDMSLFLNSNNNFTYASLIVI